MASPARAEGGSARASLLAIAAGLFVLYLAVQFLWPLVLTLLVGGAVYYLLTPIVGLLERRRIPRIVGTLVSYVALLAVLVVFFWTLIPPLYGEVEQLGRDLPGYVEGVEAWLAERELLGEEADPRAREAARTVFERSGDFAVEGLNRLLAAVGGLFSSLFALLFGLIVGFYLLLGGPRLGAAIPSWIPPQQRDRWTRFAREADAILAGYLRARLIASVFVGTSYGVAFWLLGIEQAVLLGVIGGVLNLVPVVGPILAAIPAAIIAAFHSFALVVAVLVIMFVAQQIESAVINPHLEGHYVRLPPAVVVLAVATASALVGIVGLLLAVPVAGLARAALDVFYREPWAEGEP